MAHREHVDVLIVGAGLSGVGAAHHLRAAFPQRSLAILEARDAIGGTWDLFRYPGIRSDSDMHTLGYSFRPWTASKAIADGPSILEYVRETAREDGTEHDIRFGVRVTRAAWSTPDARWTVTAERLDGSGELELTCGFLHCCSGYYDYAQGYSPEFPGIGSFRGEVVHPQHWPADLDYAGKRVVVIGSGATAVTLVPAMAPDAEHVTMLQRSPTYVTALPNRDPVGEALRGKLPAELVYRVVRWKNVALHVGSYQLSRRFPSLMKRVLRAGVKRQLPDGYAVDTHFKPRYDPWDQRLCVVPDGDLFRSISAGRSSVATGQIDTFTPDGIRLESGEHLDADVVITATGLNLLVFGGIELEVDGREVRLPETMAYKGMMLSGVPNFAFCIGYTNASWTLKADLVAEYLCRLLAHMDRTGDRIATPRRDETSDELPFLDFEAGYVKRSIHLMPKQGERAPWRLRMNYVLDLPLLRYGSVDDEGMAFSRPGAPADAAPPAEPVAA